MFAAASTNFIEITSILLRIFNYQFKNCLIKTFRIKNFIEISIFGMELKTKQKHKNNKKKKPMFFSFFLRLINCNREYNCFSPAATTSFSPIPSGPIPAARIFLRFCDISTLLFRSMVNDN